MLSEAQKFWDAINGKVKGTVANLTQNAFRCERYEVTTAPNGTKIGVTLPMGTNELFLPYSKEVSNAAVGSSVLVVWWGSMSNAKVYYFANGYMGASPLDARPVGSLYISLDSTEPGELFGGDWYQIEDTFLLAAGSVYSAGDTGGAATVTLTTDEIPAHTHGSKTLTGWARFRAMDPAASDNRNMVNSASGIVSRSADSGLQPGFRNSSGRIEVQSQYNRIDITATHEHTSVGGGEAHENMPPYLAVYVWQRIA